jgi:hypothetical protein
LPSIRGHEPNEPLSNYFRFECESSSDLVQARAIAAVIVRSGTIAKCSGPFSSYEIISDVFLVEKLTKSRWSISNTRPEAVSILNGLFFATNSSTNDASIRFRCYCFEYARQFPRSKAIIPIAWKLGVAVLVPSTELRIRRLAQTPLQHSC